MRLPRIVQIIRDREPLDDLKATAGKLWLDYGGKDQDTDGSIGAALAAYWKARPGKDPYWDFLARRGFCDACGESNKFENMPICPNCFSTYCYKHGRACACGHQTLG